MAKVYHRPCRIRRCALRRFDEYFHHTGYSGPLSPKRDLIAAKLFLRLALRATSGIRPRVINVDGRPAYASAVEELKQSGELGRRCRGRTSPYLNNVIEQDHRFIKKRITASQGFRSAEGAWRTIEGYEACMPSAKGRSVGSARAIL
jgi:transposase-like protein